MKKTILWSLPFIALLACNQNQKPVETQSKSAEAKAQYEKNLAVFKAAVTAFENEKIDEWAASVADNAVWHPAAYGAAVGTKEDWKKALSFYATNWDSLKLKNATFLPGMDSVTHELDGSVRYYGIWTGTHKSGVRTASPFYGSFDFNKDGKVIDATEFFDVGGLMNAVAPKSAKK